MVRYGFTCVAFIFGSDFCPLHKTVQQGGEPVEIQGVDPVRLPVIVGVAVKKPCR
jgi:hypothetical protein